MNYYQICKIPRPRRGWFFIFQNKFCKRCNKETPLVVTRMLGPHVRCYYCQTSLGLFSKLKYGLPWM